MIFSFLYVIVFSVALVLIQKLDMSIPPLLSLLFTASIASIYFNFINKQHFKKMYLDCIQNFKQWITVMFIVLIMWVTTMVGPSKIGASLFNFIYFSWLGIIGFFIASLKNGEQNKYKFYFGLSLLILVSINIYNELNSSFSYQSLSGILLALLGGTASFIYFKKSQALAKNAELSATQVLAVRFYLAIIVLLIIIPKQHVIEHFTIINCINLTILAFFSLIIPLYFSQKALEKISSEQHAIINSSCPLVTGLLQEFIFKDLKKEQVIIYLCYSLAIASFYFISKLKDQSKLEYMK